VEEEGMRLLVVEDETRMAEILKRGLEEEGYAVTVASDGKVALEMAEASDFELLVLDVMLPRMNGFEVAKHLRESGKRLPILMLTARDATPDIVQGLDLGADDYLTKPFSFEVLLARIRALLRRGPVAQAARLKLGDLELDPGRHEVTRGGEAVRLTRTEFNLLEYLMRRAGRVVPRDVLISAVWGYDRTIESNTLDAFVRLLRSKIEGSSGERVIHTVRGIGFVARAGELE
jgi:DNA-binding response OmpR family regulator